MDLSHVDYLWIIVIFLSTVGLTFWRHPFTAEDLLGSKLCNFSKSAPKKKQTHLHLGWPEGESIFSNFSFLGVNYSFKWTHLDKFSILTPCLVSVYLESILILNSLSTSRTNEMAPVSGFMYSRKESFTISHLNKAQKTSSLDSITTMRSMCAFLKHYYTDSSERQWYSVGLIREWK